ncbi:MAG TPA: DNA polymerase III subunit alpha [Planctomycetaceae bacterium]|nr:DNA polymerase III subunit alpha [Planctomycetaceae bacterium]
MGVRRVLLHCRSNFSFLEGASYPEELCQAAADHGYAAIAVTDVHSLAGIVQAHQAARRCGIQLVVGAEIRPRGGPPGLLWAPDRRAYAGLCRLLTRGLRAAEKGACRLHWEDVFREAGDCLAAMKLPRAGDASAEGWLHRFREAFGERGAVAVGLHQGVDDAGVVEWAKRVARRTRLPLLADDDVRYHHRRRWPLWEVLAAVKRGTTVEALGADRLPNTTWAMPNRRQHERRWSRLPEALETAEAWASRCRFSLEELRYEYPLELAPPGETPLEHLQKLTWEGARRRYPQGIPAKVRRLLEHELRLIGELGYEAYFLTVWDLVRFARQRKILCQGRGSAANSAVCYCLGITAVDPERMDVLFERFVSRERNEAPDIDVDFEHERREEVLQYLYEKYGRDRAAMTGVTITYQLRSAIRDVGKALGLSWDRVDQLAKQVQGYTWDPKLPQRCQEVGIDPESRTGRQLVHLVKELIGFPRHLSQHVGGMVMTRGPLCELVPIENAAMPGRTVIQWNKDDLDALGILKVDCLALGILTALHRCFDLIERHEGKRWELPTIPPDDPEVYEAITRADTVGVFQIESRAQMSMLPRLKPRCYYDLVIEVAIVRPGPIQGQMVHPYLRRRAGEEPVEYPNDAIRDVLEKTLGVPIFQEQAMRLAMVAAGFTPGEADQLRRAMGAWRRPGLIDAFRQKLLEGMLRQGLSREFAEQVFQQIRGFGEYGFPESHAASFALLAYASAWLKHHYPAAYTAALLNSQPMGFYAPAQLVDDLRRHGGEVRPVDVQRSEWDCTLERLENETRGHRCALRLGFRLVRGLSEQAIEPLLEARRQAPFRSVLDLVRRARLSRTVLERLTEADALASLVRDRRQAKWELLAADAESEIPLWSRCEARKRGGEDTSMLPLDRTFSPPPLSLPQQVVADYESTGLSLKAHPLSFYRETLRKWGVLRAVDLAGVESDRVVQVAGLVLLRQRPSTARGITFVTLEDETGTVNLVVHQTTWDRFYEVARRASAWLAKGKLQSESGVIHVVAFQLEDLARRLALPTSRSRDFR